MSFSQALFWRWKCASAVYGSINANVKRRSQRRSREGQNKHQNYSHLKLHFFQRLNLIYSDFCSTILIPPRVKLVQMECVSWWVFRSKGVLASMVLDQAQNWERTSLLRHPVATFRPGEHIWKLHGWDVVDESAQERDTEFHCEIVHDNGSPDRANARFICFPVIWQEDWHMCHHRCPLYCWRCGILWPYFPGDTNFLLSKQCGGTAVGKQNSLLKI